ncbi:unnamed protein product [Jaminaea pallidilutea]
MDSIATQQERANNDDDPSSMGCSASSSSSSSAIYHHPFASFDFGTSVDSSPDDQQSSKQDAYQKPLEITRNTPDQHHIDTNSLRTPYPGTSGDNSAAQRYASSGDNSPSNVPPSPATSYAESQHSMDEYEMDSPSSISSWNSFGGTSGYRGDVADVEDFELGEPELETVSEMDEDNPAASSSGGTMMAAAASSSSGGRSGAHHHHHHHQHHSSNQHHSQQNHHSSHGLGHHFPASTAFSHFSPRSGGHGLSHHSRWTSRTPASVAARRRKGRIAELAEEGAAEGHGVQTTNMGTAIAANDRSSGSSLPSNTGDSGLSNGSPHHRSSAHSSSGEHSYPGTPPNTQWSDFGVPPPPPPFRSVSPSETVPAVPSPLCECINAAPEAPAEGGSTESELLGATSKLSLDDVLNQTPTSVTETTAAGAVKGADDGSVSTADGGGMPAPTPRRGVLDAATHRDLSGTQSTMSVSPPSPTSTASTAAQTVASSSLGVGGPSSPDTTPPSSPVQLNSRSTSRKDSSRTRRSSSPAQSSRHRPPLRPCFSRRNSTQAGSSSASASEYGEIRGRCHVRFSPAPPQTMRTHSPIDYDRSSCPINNRLSVEDVEEMQKLEMDMGLLSAKCSAIAAITSCKLPAKPGDPSDPGNGRPGLPISHSADAVAGSLSSSSSSSRPRRDSTGNLAHHLGGGYPSAVKPTSNKYASPAEHLRAQREKERERACRIAGIGTGLGGRNLGSGTNSKTANPLIARFGLTTPPPPLPGTNDSFDRRTPQQRSASPDKSVFDRDRTVSPPAAAAAQQGRRGNSPLRKDGSRFPRASSLSRTLNEERAILRTHNWLDSDADDGLGADEGRGRSRGRPALTSETVGGSAVLLDDKADGKENGPSTPVQPPALMHTSPSPPPSSYDALYNSTGTGDDKGEETVTARDSEYPSFSDSCAPLDDSAVAESSPPSTPLVAACTGYGYDSCPTSAAESPSQLCYSPNETPMPHDIASAGISNSSSSKSLGSLSPSKQSGLNSYDDSDYFAPKPRLAPPSTSTSTSASDDGSDAPATATKEDRRSDLTPNSHSHVRRGPPPSSANRAGRSRCGYDSPGSAYESGSEYDLLG